MSDDELKNEEYNIPVEHFAGKRIDAKFFDVLAMPFALFPFLLFIPTIGFANAIFWALGVLVFFAVLKAKGHTLEALFRGIWVAFRRKRIHSRTPIKQAIDEFDL